MGLKTVAIETGRWLLVEKHENDLYRGNGKPGLTTRMAVAEGRLDDHDDVMGKLDKQGTRIIWLLVSVLVTLITLLGTELVRMVMK